MKKKIEIVEVVGTLCRYVNGRRKGLRVFFQGQITPNQNVGSFSGQAHNSTELFGAKNYV